MCVARRWWPGGRVGNVVVGVDVGVRWPIGDTAG